MDTLFVVDQKSFLSILATMQPICSKRTTLDATSSLLLSVGHKELVIKSTDLEISLQASYVVLESTFFERESFLVPGKRFFDIIKELDGDIVCTKTKNQLQLVAGKVQISLNIKDADEFPPFPERIENLMQLDALVFQDIFNKVGFLIPQNNANPSLNGLLIEISPQGTTMTATDGHCLAQVHTSAYKLDQQRKWLLPRRAVFELKKLLETYQEPAVFLGVCNNQLVFSGESFNFFTKLLVDSFPHYQTILNRDDFIAAKIDRVPFIKTVRRCVSLLSGQFIATQFTFQPALLKVGMQNNDVGSLSEELGLSSFDGDDVNIRFYAPYLLSGLNVFPGESLQLYLKNSSRPIIFETHEAAYRLLYLVMPVAPLQPSQS
jgi:DNA polymerase III subunit beta